ncbi:MAG: family 43 glycosylhydrolase [Lachnospiraceae bacterium]|nr:family 43 glycosylhydrolase [Lachnospiraceae bacterium]
MSKIEQSINPLTRLDYPDPDVIRVEDTYYMVSTTMYFMPGCEILRSYDLVNWEHAAFVYDELDGTPGQRLEGEADIYGKGMWAASLRYHKGTFYVCFVANDTGKTYLYRASSIEGPWKKSIIEGFYHDCSLLFDEDDRVYIAYGNKYIHLLELKADLTGPKEGGIDRIVVSDEGHPGLGYEGTHFYKIGGRYYLFFIHSLRDRWKRVEACFAADSLEGEFVGGDVLNDDMGYCNQGVAQGGIVDTPDGDWYAVLFQDRGAVGRIPVLLPIHWESGYPVFGVDGRVPQEFTVKSTRPDYVYEPLVQSDDFTDGYVWQGKGLTSQRVVRDAHYDSFGFKSCWQFNHEPDMKLVKRDLQKGTVEITTDKLCKNLTRARNTLTQRMLFPACAGEVTVDGSGLKEGDFAGLCALQGCYGMIALTKRNDKLYVVMMNRPAPDSDLAGRLKDEAEGTLQGEAELTSAVVRFRVSVDFAQMKDEAAFYYDDGEGFKQLGVVHKLCFKLDHFTGCRLGLFVYSTKECGGSAIFSEFTYKEQ